MYKITGIILAGGQSSRMGTNKALLNINGEKNIQRLTQELKKVTEKIMIITNEFPTYEFLNLEMAGDVFPGKGPLGGIHSGLLHSSSEWNIFVACDLPFFNHQIVNSFIELGKGSTVDAIVPSINGRQHPLFAMYRSSILPAVEECLSQDRLRIKDLLNRISVYEVTERDLIKIGFSEKEINEAFFNMNYPEDYTWVMEKVSSTKDEN
ncbi:molybdopterin-guanine dinucleotide biosynthesis protein A [Evansella vedderi]|uniref:Probable molybdenum cofactor guanylyltransferase n=1 Tax=Evansella vedderi TaxID=38282 RepID=A0ABT9ZUF6_9BACI|nr:molybdenum cofactor guanylyltransferase [Evansella vedderi]MDQ0254881.1 molybdopterin-guanine dinucleotide biosynthesis protein A [Evansella vedderi]